MYLIEECGARLFRFLLLINEPKNDTATSTWDLFLTLMSLLIGIPFLLQNKNCIQHDSIGELLLNMLVITNQSTGTWATETYAAA